ncbi:MAG TPA: HD domain-containing phosphohydrolase [Anaerolineales bacterium]|nr:HD domain-containing phosphohydrolase [Anaerolineales bacterium]
MRSLFGIEQVLETGFQAFTDLIAILDYNGFVLEGRQGNLSPKILPDEVSHRELRDIFPAPAADKLERALNSVKQTGLAASLEFPLSIHNHEFWFEVRLAPLSQTQALLTARDVTRCHETEFKIRRQMEQLSALRSIDLAIASGLDLSLLLSMLLEQVAGLLGIDAASVLLLNPKTTMLEFVSGKGFRSNILRHTRLKLGEGCAGRVAQERRLINVLDLQNNRMEFTRSPLFAGEGFITYYGVPLIAKGRVLGVLEIFQRSSLNPDSDWLDFLKTIAGQAAIAIDNAMMFKELQISNIELNLAYDATIEGLSRALDLRDKETEEHTRRVTDITLKLASALGVAEADKVHIRRGAILHDIGKVAIPDQILFKRGPLVEEEWKIMKQHPDIAVQLLSPVTYLTHALDIPHWHHEKWDGTGYPDQLTGERIPFFARLFAFADVYDAMTSDRPYRPAWQREDALQYIDSQSGRHFDPNIMPVFMELANTQAI